MPNEFTIEDLVGQTPTEKTVAEELTVEGLLAAQARQPVSALPDTTFKVEDLESVTPTRPIGDPIERLGQVPLRFGIGAVESLAEGAIQLAQLIPGDLGGLDAKFPGGDLKWIEQLEESGVLFEAGAVERIAEGTGRVAAFFAPVNVASKALLALKAPRVIATFAPIAIGSFAAMKSQADAEGRPVSGRELGVATAQILGGVFAGKAGTSAAQFALSKLMSNEKLVAKMAEHIGNAALGGAFEVFGAAAQGADRQRLVEAFVEGTLGAVIGAVAANRFPGLNGENLSAEDAKNAAEVIVEDVKTTDITRDTPIGKAVPFQKGQRLVDEQRVFADRRKFRAKSRDMFLEEAAIVDKRKWPKWLREQIEKAHARLDQMPQEQLVKKRIRELSREGYSVSEVARELTQEGFFPRGVTSSKSARNMVRAYKAVERIPSAREAPLFNAWRESKRSQFSKAELDAFNALPRSQRQSPRALAQALDEALRVTRAAPDVELRMEGASLAARSIIGIQEALKVPPKQRPPFLDPLMGAYQKLSKKGKAEVRKELTPERISKQFKLTREQARASLNEAREAMGLEPLVPPKRGRKAKPAAQEEEAPAVPKKILGEKKKTTGVKRTEGKKAKKTSLKETTAVKRGSKLKKAKNLGEVAEILGEKAPAKGKPKITPELQEKLQKAKSPEEVRTLLSEAQKRASEPAKPKASKKTLGARKRPSAPEKQQPKPAKAAAGKKPSKPLREAPEGGSVAATKAKLEKLIEQAKTEGAESSKKQLNKLVEARKKREATDLPIAVRRADSLPSDAKPITVGKGKTKGQPAAFKTADQAMAFAESFALEHPNVPLVTTYRSGAKPFEVLAGAPGSLKAGAVKFDAKGLRETLAELGVVGAEKMSPEQLVQETVRRLQPSPEQVQEIRRQVLGEGEKIAPANIDEAPLQEPTTANRIQQHFDERMQEVRERPVAQSIEDNRLELVKAKTEEAELLRRLGTKLTNDERQVVQAELNAVRSRIGIEEQIAADLVKLARKQRRDVMLGSGFGALQQLYEHAMVHVKAIRDHGGTKAWMEQARERDKLLKKGLPSRKTKELHARELTRAYEAALPFERHRPPGFWRQALTPALDILAKEFDAAGRWLATRAKWALTFTDQDEGTVLQRAKLIRLPGGFGVHPKKQFTGEKSVIGKSALDRPSRAERDNMVELKDWHVMRLVNENPKKFIGEKYEGGPIEFPGFDPAKPPEPVSQRVEAEVGAWLEYYMGVKLKPRNKEIARAQAELVEFANDLFPYMERRAVETGIEVATRDANGHVTLHPFQPNLGPNGKFWPYMMWDRAMRPTTDQITTKKGIVGRLAAEKDYNARWEFADLKREQIARLEAARKGVTVEEIIEVMEHDMRNRQQPFFRYTLESQAKRAGHIEFSRKMEGLLGGEVSFAEVIPQYVRPALLRMRYVEQFGHGGGKASRVIENLARRGFDAQAAKHIFELSMEQIPEAMDSRMSPRFVRELAGAATVSMLPWAGVTQTTSFATIFAAARTSDNPFAVQNYRGFFPALTKAIQKSLVDLGLSKEQQDRVEAMRIARSGGPLEGERVNWQMANSGIMPRAAGVALHLNGLVPIDRFLRGLASSWGRTRTDVFGEEYRNAMRKGDTKRLAALDEKLRWFDFPLWDNAGKRVRPEQDFRRWHELSPERREFYRNMVGWTVAYRTQARTRFADLPPLANDPYIRPIFKFSQFAIRQTHETFRRLWTEVIDRRDVSKVSATLRYLANLIPAGVAAWYIADIRELMMEPNREKRRERALRSPLWQQFAYRVAFANHLPWYIDWLNASARERGLASRLMGPVYGQILDMSEYAIPAAFKGDPGPMMRYLVRTYGPVPFLGGPSGSPIGRAIGFPSGREVLEGKEIPGMGRVQEFPVVGRYLRTGEKKHATSIFRRSDFLRDTTLPSGDPALRLFLPATRSQRRSNTPESASDLRRQFIRRRTLGER